MGLQHAVLGLLAQGPSYGYELKASFEEAIGPQWGELNIGHVYQILDRLVRDGQVTRKVHPQAARPDRVVYRLTKEGRGELRRWLSEPSRRQSGYRDDFFLKLFVASKGDVSQLRMVARTQHEAYLRELAGLTTLRRTHRGDPFVRLLIETAILHTKANLRVSELADEQAEAMVEGGSSRSGRDSPSGSDERPVARQGNEF